MSPAPPPVIFLHGLESTVDADLRPCGRKALFLGEAFDATLVPLDTRAAQASARRARERGVAWSWPLDDYEESFALPMARARAALPEGPAVIVGSSFGGAVALRLLHEGLVTHAILLAGAGMKLTPYRSLPPAASVHLVHGRHDDIVPPDDSVALAESSPRARLTLVEDDHRLATVVTSDGLGVWVSEMRRESARA